MDTDLTLIEMSREDDSLLQQMPNEEACSIYSSFSPLCSFRLPKPSPRTLGLMGMEDSERPSSSSCGEIVNKENVNSNKPVMPKLSIERQQMKKKKKGGGYNLRKSLAWDKAFFTEEGVLDPIELSMISGNLNSLGGEKLSVIHEEGRESLPEVPEEQNDSTNALALEEKPFKNLPVKAKSGTKRPVGFSPQKHNNLAKNNGPITSTAKRRVLSAQDVNMSGSKHSGCPRPTNSSSLKKPVNINPTKGAAKELKVLRMPVARADSGLANPSAKRSTPGGHLKQTQPTRASAAEKNIRVQGSLRSTKTVATSAITGSGNKCPTSKSTLPQAKRNVGKVAATLGSSTHVKAASERLKDQVKPPIPHVPSGHCSDTSKMEALLPQNRGKLDGNVPNVPIQTAKPSGLRMPSPSIRFFDQPKSSASQNLVKKCVQTSNIPQPTGSIPRDSYPMKILRDIRPPLGHDRLQKLVSNSPSGSSSMTFTALTGLSTSSLGKSDALYGMQKTEQPQNGPIDEISSKQQDLQNIPSDGGEQDREFVEPCEPDKQLPPNEGNVKLNGDKLLTSIKPRCGMIKHEHEKYIDIPSESKDPDLGSSVDTRANPHVGFMLQTEDICMANMQETSALSSETPSSLCHQSQPAKSFSDDQNILTLVNQTGSSNEPHGRVCAENADCISNYNNDTAGEAARSKVQNDSAGSKDGSRKSHVEDEESPVHDDNLAISGPMDGKNAVGKFIVGSESLGCQNMDHCLSDTWESLIGSQGSYTDLQLRNDAQLSEKTSDLNEELPLLEDDGRSKGVTATTDSENPCASLSGVVFCKMEMEAGHSMSLLTAVKDEIGPEIGYLAEHENVEESQCHLLDQKISQDISSPTTGTEVHCFDETLTGYFKGKPNSDNRNMTIVQPQTVGSGVGDADCYQTPVEDEYTDLADGEVIDAYGTSLKMKFEQQDPSYDILLSNSAATDEIVTASDLVEQSDDHPDLQDCLFLDDHPTKKGLFVDDNLFHESNEKNSDNGGCESELTRRIEPLSAEPDPYGGPDVVDKKAEKNYAQNVLLSDVMIHDDKASNLNTKLEVGVSLGMTDEKILESPTAAYGKEAYPSSEAISLESSRSHVEVDLPLDHCAPDVQLQYHSESTSHPTEQEEATVPQEECKDSQKQNGLLIKPPKYAPPFSDEWLAAIEAAGEEILTMKGGAVQNSPPDKTMLEPGPWSPVKKKHNQGIGPFDCTKFTNTATNIPHSSPQ